MKFALYYLLLNIMVIGVIDFKLQISKTSEIVAKQSRMNNTSFESPDIKILEAGKKLCVALSCASPHLLKKTLL